MSRFLFSFMGGHGHFVPLVPVARAAQSAGHRVAFACGSSRAAAVEAAGFEAIALGPKGREELTRTALRPLDAAREAEEFRDRFADGATRSKIPVFEEACKAWRPDVVICDEAELGSLLVAERLGLPYASILVMAAGAFVRPALITGVLNAIRSELGLAPDPDLAMLHRYLSLSPFPRRAFATRPLRPPRRSTRIAPRRLPPALNLRPGPACAPTHPCSTSRWAQSSTSSPAISSNVCSTA